MSLIDNILKPFQDKCNIKLDEIQIILTDLENRPIDNEERPSIISTCHRKINELRELIN